MHAKFHRATCTAQDAGRSCVRALAYTFDLPQIVALCGGTFMKTLPAVCVAALLAATAAAAQTSTTTTKSKTTTTTTTNTWQSPDGTRGGSHTTSNTNTKSKSLTVGTPQPQRPSPHNSGWTGFQHSAGQSPYAGGWRLTVGKGRPCMLTLYQSSNAQGGGATTSGCTSSDLQAVGNWVLQGGQTLTLTRGLVSTVATLTRTGPSRFQGMTKSGEPIAVWR